MKECTFYIITPTYRRPNELKRTVDSCLHQTFINWKLLIINDSPDCDYSDFESNTRYKDERISYIKNESNRGNNYCKNLGLNYIRKKNKKENSYIIFLDDDDWLADDVLPKINAILLEQKDQNNIRWLVTNRYDIKNKKSLTINTTNKKESSYFWDYLIFKRFKGDATHTIATQLALSAHFSHTVKNGEEWFFFTQLKSKFTYKDVNATETEGYLDGGLTKKSKEIYKRNTQLLWTENNILLSAKMLTYMLLRMLKKFL